MSTPETSAADPDRHSGVAPGLPGYAVVLAPLALGLAALVVALATRNARTALLHVLPTVLAMLLGGGAAAWGLMRRHAPLWLMLAGTALATWAAMMTAVLALATLSGRPLADMLARPVVERGMLGAPMLGALIGAGLWLLERARLRERNAWEAERAARLRQEQLQHERTLAHLRLLQAQIEPHFIYNTLANLRQLVRRDSTRALHMLDHLIRYFQLVLPSFRAEQLPLADELALVRAYLELLRERMDRPMHLSTDVPETLATHALPTGALLCLAENAVKHGLPEEGGLLLRVTARRVGGCLVLTVLDNGAGLPSGAPGTALDGQGTGLANLRERLRLLYGDAAGVALHNAHPGCEAVLTLPWAKS